MGTYVGELVVEGLLADGNSDEWGHRGGEGSVSIQGTFGSGTVKLQRSLDGGTTYIDVPADVSALGTALSCTEDATFDITSGACMFRVNISGSTSPNVKVYYSPNYVIIQA